MLSTGWNWPVQRPNSLAKLEYSDYEDANK